MCQNGRSRSKKGNYISEDTSATSTAEAPGPSGEQYFSTAMNPAGVLGQTLLQTGSWQAAEEAAESAAAAAHSTNISKAVKVPDKLLSVLFPVSIVQ